MRKAVRRTVIGLGVFIGLLVLAIVCVSLFFNINRYKPQIEAAVERSTGMDLRINGNIGLKILPSTRIVLNDVHVRNRGSDLLTAKKIEATPDLYAYFFHHEIKVGKIYLDHPRVNIEKSAAGRMNYEASHSSQSQAQSKVQSKKKSKAGQKSEAKSEPVNIHSVEVTGAELNYIDHTTQKRIQANGVNAKFSGIEWGAQNQGNRSSKYAFLRSVSFHGTVDANSLAIGKTQVTDLKAKVQANRGLVQLESTDLKIFSGTVQGNGQADFRSAIPKWTIDQKATGLNSSQFSDKTQGKVSGLVNASLNLSGNLSGKLAAAGSRAMTMINSLAGKILVQSQNIQIKGGKLDEIASGLKAIPDLRALFSDHSVIQKLVMNWTIHNGIASATDVAFSTPEGRVAARGEVNLANKTFQNFYLANVDDKGCSKRQVEIVGTLNAPRPSVKSLGEQVVRSEIGKSFGPGGADIAGIAGFGGGKRDQGTPGCDHFYSGSLVSAK